MKIMSNSFQLVTEPVESRDITSVVWCNTDGIVDHNLFSGSPVRLVTHRHESATSPMIAIGVAMNISPFFYGGEGKYPFEGSTRYPRLYDGEVRDELEKFFTEAVSKFFELQVDRDVYLSVHPFRSGSTPYNQNDDEVSLVFEVQLTFALDKYMRLYLETERGKNDEYAPLSVLAEALKPFEEMFEQKIASGMLFDEFHERMRVIRKGDDITSFLCDNLLGR